MELKTKLKKRRRELNMTQEELALKAGIDKGHISRLENGKFERISVKTMNKLAIALNVELDWFDSTTVGKSEIYTIELDDEIAEILTKYSSSTGISESDIVADLIEKYINQNK